MNKIVYGVVTVFDPKPDFHTRLKLFSSQVAGVVVVNDSGVSCKVDYLLSYDFLSNIHIIDNDYNMGIASSLNRGAEYALSKGCDYIVFLDDDTVISPSYVKNAILSIESYSNDDVVIGGVMVDEFRELSLSFNRVSNKKVRNLITSGTVISSSLFQKVKGFDESFFIDNVDFEFCFRLRQMGVKLFLLDSCQIQHSIGNIKVKNFVIFNVFVFNHSPFRLYYQVRNIFLYWHKFLFKDPFFCFYQFYGVFKMFFKVVFFESQKLLRLKYCFKGLYHGIINRGGRIS